jgi:type IV pilus assembly protein PilQ
LVVSRQDREYVGEPIDMSLKKADLVETLRTFATISDLNFVIQPGVSGSVTVELKGVPWDQAMEQILKINNLGMDIDGTIVRIAPMSQLRAEAEEQRRLAQARQESVPLRTVLKSLSYSSAPDVAALLRNRTGSILSNRGTVQVDRRTNTLIIRELPEFVDTVLAVIDNLDAPEPQVTIEARIIEATKSFSRSLGIQWDFAYDASPATGNTTGLAFPNTVGVDGSVGLLTGGDNGLLTFSLGNLLNTFNLDARLQLAESEGLVNLVSAPRVTTLNNTSATIQSGVQIPIQTVANNTVSVQFVNATLNLTVTPQVTAEGTIMMDIQVAKRSPQPGLAVTGSANSPISTREARTKVIVRDGGTAVIGGIYEVSSNQVQDRLPGLANIPIPGHLFKNRNRSNSNDELMIFITPRIVQM